MKRFLLILALPLLTALAMTAQTFRGDRTDFRDETIYFLLPTRFYDGDPSNNTQCWENRQRNQGDPAWRGDFKGLIEKLDYIKALGFTAIWITPVVQNASGYDYHGYHALDFSRVDRRHESDGVTLQTLIDAVHQHGMKIIIDIVLNHTGNFGEEHLCKLFNRDWTQPQSQMDACMVPWTQQDGGRLPDNYLDLSGVQQYNARLEQMKDQNNNTQNDYHNYWHHFGNFNWDNETRWWAQIAGDCVDLNTENPQVSQYLVDCYTKFINMGADAFRIDTGGHIARLTFNNHFLPQLHQAAEAAKAKRGGTPFFMYAEVCARYTTWWYRNQPALSCPFYTWKEQQDYPWDYDGSSWDGLRIASDESTDFPHVNMQSCEQLYRDNREGSESRQPVSDNAFLHGNDYHVPDYSQFSGLSVIDFPMHHSFKDISSAWGILNGTYTDCVTGDRQTVTDGTLTVNCQGKGNMRVYVLSTDKTPAPGKVVVTARP